MTLCMGIVAYYRVKYMLQETNQPHGNARARLNANNNAVSRVKNNKEDVNASQLNLGQNDIPMKRFNNIQITTTTPENRSQLIAAPYILNNNVYNKILVEVNQIILIILCLTIKVASGVVKRSLTLTTVEEYSRILLFFLDLSPAILMSIVLPVAIHVRNPEILGYVKGCFANDPNHRR